MARFLGALVLCLIVAVFAVENSQAVHLAFLGLHAPGVSLAFVVLAALVLGALVTVLLGSLQILTLRRRLAGLERELGGRNDASPSLPQIGLLTASATTGPERPATGEVDAATIDAQIRAATEAPGTGAGADDEGRHQG